MGTYVFVLLLDGDSCVRTDQRVKETSLDANVWVTEYMCSALMYTLLLLLLRSVV